MKDFTVISFIFRHSFRSQVPYFVFVFPLFSPLLLMFFPPSLCITLCLSIQQEEQGTRKRVAFRFQGGEGKSDDGTPLTGRVTIGEDFTLTISSVQPSDELVFYCQVTAGPAGVTDATTMLKVFCELAFALWPFI